ncbi:ATP-binding cassette domain-containing protein [Candidatus Venteria ishoeyi]|uniref:Tetratricopeptide repeat protein n=1 Tax=Candidatus Venteria ishoeyi TaxID=1899563 RepID=A0A1H6FE19_9GAMM|nr:ABC transporter ATP-binding protein [Candidatus Venteria ishoeyi]SEH08312.1 Uncharacterised protein [Candidatus Venteria ishoeyi]
MPKDKTTNKLLKKLKKLLFAEFEEIIFHYGIPVEYLNPGSQTQRAIEIIRYAENNNELSKLQQALAKVKKPEAASHPDIHIQHLPTPSSQLLGRTEELNQLNQSFKNPKQRLMVLVASGGTGKSALTEMWLSQIAPNYGGVSRVFGWSFYSQGHHRLYTDSGAFFREVLPFLGQAQIPTDETDKGRLLADCLAQQPVLLILDGLEPLQLDNVGNDGSLKDSALRAFFTQLPRSLQQQNKSFVLISSRQPLVELKTWQDDSYHSLGLKHLSSADGALLLKTKGVVGTETQRQQLANDAGNHALTLALLGALLKQQYEGKIVEEWKTLNAELEPADNAQSNEDRHCQRILSWYQQNLPENNKRFLFMLGLFDRPLGWEEKNELFNKADWCKPLKNLSTTQLQSLEQQLETAGLLAPNPSATNGQQNARMQWDCHALIRSWAGKSFVSHEKAAFIQAQKVLFAYYQQLPAKQQPDSLEELQPLYRAVGHGCLAGEYQAAMYEVYYKRILREQEYYSSKKLGAYAQDLSALAAFFPQGWRQPEHTGLSVADQAWLLAAAAFRLMSLGRLSEALAPRAADLELSIKIKDWKGASTTARNLTDLHLPLGNLEQAAVSARQAVAYAQQTEDLFEQTTNYASLASVLHRQGLLEQAATAFKTAEEKQVQDDPESPRLYSTDGAYYCAFLLDLVALANNRNEYSKSEIAKFGIENLLLDCSPQEAIQEVLERAQYGLKIAQDYKEPLSIALDHLSIARAQAALKQNQAASNSFDLAVKAIEEAKKHNHLPPFYLSRANFQLQQGETNKARQDLDAAWAIINANNMELYAVDAHLLEAAYHQLIPNQQQASLHQQQAEMKISNTGYKLRELVPLS